MMKNVIHSVYLVTESPFHTVRQMNQVLYIGYICRLNCIDIDLCFKEISSTTKKQNKLTFSIL